MINNDIYKYPGGGGVGSLKKLINGDAEGL